MIFLILVFGVLGLVFLLLPTLQTAKTQSTDTRRTELEEERELLLSNIAELQTSGQDQTSLTREKVRLNNVLHELDQLPPVQSVKARPTQGVAISVLLGVVVVTVLGSFTFFKSWRYSGLSAQEQAKITNAIRLPGLEQKAMKSQAQADLMAWGDAAWSAQKYKLAARAYTLLLMQNRGEPKAMRRVGYVLLRDRKMAKNGLKFIQRSVVTAPKDPEGFLLYGYALGLFGQYDEALEMLKKHQSLAPESKEADGLIVEYQRQAGKKVSGQALYAQNCASCHGQAGEGGTAPKLVGAPALQNKTALENIILKGATGMPAFPQFKGQQLEALVKYMESWK